MAKNTKPGTASDEHFAGLQSENESEWSSESGDQDTCVLSVINLGTETREDWTWAHVAKHRKLFSVGVGEEGWFE